LGREGDLIQTNILLASDAHERILKQERDKHKQELHSVQTQLQQQIQQQQTQQAQQQQIAAAAQPPPHNPTHTYAAAYDVSALRE